jgi:hypothetical protein
MGVCSSVTKKQDRPTAYLDNDKKTDKKGMKLNRKTTFKRGKTFLAERKNEE